MKEHAWNATLSLWTLLPPSWVTKFNFQLSSALEPLPMPLPLPFQWQACPRLQVATEQPSSYYCSVGFGPELPSFWVQCWGGHKAQSNSDLGMPEQHRPLRPKLDNPELCKQWSNVALAPRFGCGHLRSFSLFSRLMQLHTLNPYTCEGRQEEISPLFWDHSFLLSQLQNYCLLLLCFPTV